nr:hypothetical protein Iba_chr10fCG7990 [Ipomoea batatas]
MFTNNFPSFLPKIQKFFISIGVQNLIKYKRIIGFYDTFIKSAIEWPPNFDLGTNEALIICYIRYLTYTQRTLSLCVLSLASFFTIIFSRPLRRLL